MASLQSIAGTDDAVSDRHNLILLLSVLLAVVILLLVIVITVFLLAHIKGKRNYGEDTTMTSAPTLTLDSMLTL